eukprot:828294-Pleurochrysis_carterae.AAC.1
MCKAVRPLRVTSVDSHSPLEIDAARFELVECARQSASWIPSRRAVPRLPRSCPSFIAPRCWLQAHLVEGWEEGWADRPSASQRRLMLQLLRLNGCLAGGIFGYISRARTLLSASADGTNPLEGYVPSVPDGISLDLASADFVKYESTGADAMGACAFVLVAGGLGERLGYSGIKVSLPPELLTGSCYLQLYLEHIAALARNGNGGKLPERTLLVIMTSDDTDGPTRQLLLIEEYFKTGMTEQHVKLVKQQKVPCLADGAGDCCQAHRSGDGGL